MIIDTTNFIVMWEPKKTLNDVGSFVMYRSIQVIKHASLKSCVTRTLTLSGSFGTFFPDISSEVAATTRVRLLL